MIAGGGGGGGTYSTPAPTEGRRWRSSVMPQAPRTGTAGRGGTLSAGGAAGDRRLVPQATAAQATVVVAEAVVASLRWWWRRRVHRPGWRWRIELGRRVGHRRRATTGRPRPVTGTGHHQTRLPRRLGRPPQRLGCREARMVMTADTPVRPDPQGVQRHRAALAAVSALAAWQTGWTADQADRLAAVIPHPGPSRSGSPPGHSSSPPPAAAAITGHDRCTCAAIGVLAVVPSHGHRHLDRRRRPDGADSSGKSEAPRSSACGAPPCSPHPLRSVLTRVDTTCLTRLVGAPSPAVVVAVLGFIGTQRRQSDARPRCTVRPRMGRDVPRLRARLRTRLAAVRIEVAELRQQSSSLRRDVEDDGALRPRMAARPTLIALEQGEPHPAPLPCGIRRVRSRDSAHRHRKV